jgi:glutamate--cysteine ligase
VAGLLVARFLVAHFVERFAHTSKTDLMVPHLVTSNPGPILALERRMLDSSVAIERWFRMQWQEHTPPFYGSVDLRNAGYKLAQVDMNLFPGGFNNLGADMLPLAVQAAQSAIEHFCCDARNLLLIPERHTRNLFYLRNVAQIATILSATGLTVRIGTLAEDITTPTTIELPEIDGHAPRITLEPLVRHGRRLGLADFDPCAILLNNDLSAGVPEILRNLNEQHVLPPVHAGWTTRRKSRHFAAYDEVCSEFAAMLDIDPWMLNPYFARSSGVDFHARIGEDDLADKVEQVLDQIRVKYAEYGITDAPFVVVKADAGTYGMGVMSVKSADEMRDLNRKTRNKMAVVKEGLQVSDVLIQEGVRTIERVGTAVAEPVVYMVDRYVVGGFYRMHAERGEDENLNAPGMQFVPLPASNASPASYGEDESFPFDAGCNLPDCSAAAGEKAPNRFYMYGVVARLALLAAARELEQTNPELVDAEPAMAQPAF